MSIHDKGRGVRWTVARLAWVSRAEVVLWFLLLLPVVAAFAGLLPLSILEGQPDLFFLGLVFFIITPLIVILVLFAGGYLIDGLLGLFRIKAVILPVEFSQQFNTILDSMAESGLPRLDSSRIRLVQNDFSVSGHVRGVFSPDVVLSAGAAVGILRNDKSSMAVLAHELAHIGHWDRLFVGLFFMIFLNLISPLLIILTATHSHELFLAWEKFSMLSVLLGFFFQFFVFSYFSRRREYAADSSASSVIGVESYQIFLRGATTFGVGHSGGYFHPSIEDRVAALDSGLVLRRTGWPIIGLILLTSTPIVMISFGGFNDASDEYQTRMSAALAMFMYALLVEWFRRTLPNSYPFDQ
jgi:Zn-dependent protease with chaperone function